MGIAAEFSPRYEQHRPDLVSLDIRGVSRLFGTPRAIAEELRREATTRGVRVHVAIAGTRMAALVLAIARPGLTVVPRGQEGAMLAPVSLHVFEHLHEEAPTTGGPSTRLRVQADDARVAMAALRRWGLKTLGELAVLPAADLLARLGRGGRVWQAIARGEDVRPLVPMQPDERFDASIDLDWPIEGREPLSFVLTRLLEPLSTRLERRDRGAAVLHVALHLITGEVHACRLELPTPMRDVRTLRTLALLDVEAHPPAAAIDRVTVTIEPTPGRIVQHALFTRPHPTPEQVSTLLARLGALMGQSRIGAPACVNTHRPGAFGMEAFALEHAPGADVGCISGVQPHSAVYPRSSDLKSKTANHQPPTAPTRTQKSAIGSRSSDLDPMSSWFPVSALRRFRHPVPARVSVDVGDRPIHVSTDRQGFTGGSVLGCAGPWRTSGAWWEEAAALGPWSRDEWEVALKDGGVYRIFQDTTTTRWFIDAIVD